MKNKETKRIRLLENISSNQDDEFKTKNNSLDFKLIN